jgi:hypothetical protein
MIVVREVIGADMGVNYLFGDEADEITKTSRFKALKVEIIQ